LPQLVYAIIPTCNRFDHNQVADQWEVIKRFHKKLLEVLVGPFCEHASDEDRRQKIILKNIRQGSYGLKTKVLECLEKSLMDAQ